MVVDHGLRFHLNRGARLTLDLKRQLVEFYEENTGRKVMSRNED